MARQVKLGPDGPIQGFEDTLALVTDMIELQRMRVARAAELDGIQPTDSARITPQDKSPVASRSTCRA